MSTLPSQVISIDISKDNLDTAGWPQPWRTRQANTADGVRQILEIARRRQATVIFEATSIYDRLLLAALDKAGLPYHRANPRKAREYARAAGFLAKTDRVDAIMLASYAAHVPLPLSEPVAPERQALRALVDRRAQLVDMRKAEATRLAQVEAAGIVQDIRAHLAELAARIRAFDAQIATALRSEALQKPAQNLASAPGIGPIITATLIALLPELGHRNAKTITALVGLAPLAHDSGRWRGRRRIWGGRPRVRTLLFLASRHAAKHPAFKAFADRLTAAGKARKLVLVAVARKLLIALNAMLSENRAFIDKPA